MLIAAAQAYDIVEPSSFAKAKFWVNELQQHGHSSTHLAAADTLPPPAKSASPIAQRLPQAFMSMGPHYGENGPQPPSQQHWGAGVLYGG